MLFCIIPASYASVPALYTLQYHILNMYSNLWRPCIQFEHLVDIIPYLPSLVHFHHHCPVVVSHPCMLCFTPAWGTFGLMMSYDA